MPRFFISGVIDNKAKIFGEDARHIAKSLRMGKGEELELCDLNGFDYKARILEVSGDLVIAEIMEKHICKTEPAIRISLFQALPKSDKLEWIAQKAVELGVYEITPVLTSRCVSRPNERDSAKKIERINKIMLEAAKQSGRGMIPKMNPVCAFKTAVSSMKGSDRAILFYERASKPLSGMIGAGLGSIAIMTGSEGGFSEDEASFAEENGVLAASLGARILRCETAPLAAISAINYATGEF